MSHPNSWLTAAVAVVAVTLPTELVAQGARSMPRVVPVDEAAQDSGFFAFRARLQRAIAGRDTAALLAVVDSTIKVSFGPGGEGLANFRRSWFERPEDDIWVELGAALSLGGRFMGDSVFYAPYTFHPFAGVPEAPEYDPFESLVVIDDGVPVLAAPSADADTLSVLSFRLVRHEWRTSVADPPPDWTAIRLPDETLGFVRSAAIRSPIDYRAIFARRDGRWRMTIFIAGD